MSETELEALLQPISEDAPCGPDLSYENEYMELDRLSQGTPERQVGTSVLPAEEPPWREVAQRARELLARSKDLRVAMILLVAELKLRGLPGLRDGLRVLHGLLDRYWPTVHPQLDPEDDNDPMVRVNVIAGLAPPPGAYSDGMQIRQRLRECRLCRSAQFGSFSWRDLAIAAGTLSPADPNEAKVEQNVIDAAFEDTPLEELQELAEAAEEALNTTKMIAAILFEQCGAGRAPDLKEFVSSLTEVKGYLARYLSARTGEARSNGDSAQPGAASDGGIASAPAGGAGVGVGEIRSNRDVINALEKICEFYARHEPASPVPILLRRAQRLVGKSFMELIQDLSPSALGELAVIRGPEGGS